MARTFLHATMESNRSTLILTILSRKLFNPYPKIPSHSEKGGDVRSSLIILSTQSQPVLRIQLIEMVSVITASSRRGSRETTPHHYKGLK